MRGPADHEQDVAAMSSGTSAVAETRSEPNSWCVRRGCITGALSVTQEDMPMSRPRHLVTETDLLAAALDAAARRWPGRSRPQLLVRLASVLIAYLDGDDRHHARCPIAVSCSRRRTRARRWRASTTASRMGRRPSV